MCTGCKYTVHGRCANKNPAPCTRTYVKSKKDVGVSQCTWLPLHSECARAPPRDVETFLLHFRFQHTTGWVETVTPRSAINARRRSRAFKAWRPNTVCGVTPWWESSKLVHVSLGWNYIIYEQWGEKCAFSCDQKGPILSLISVVLWLNIQRLEAFLVQFIC